MATIKVHSTICDHEHVIEGKKQGSEIQIGITTSCENIERMSSMKVPIREIYKYGSNYVCEMAEKSRCTATCLVPTGILIACWIEAGLLSKNLCNRSGPLQIEIIND